MKKRNTRFKKMKISKRLKIYSSLFSFMVLSGIAITASSCASNATTENNSSSQTPENQQPSNPNPTEGGVPDSKTPNEFKEPSKKETPESQEDQPQSLPDASHLFAKFYEVKQNQKFQIASKAAQQINIDTLNEYVDLPEVNIDNLTFSIKSMQANDELGIIDIELDQNYSGTTLDKTILFQITGFPTKIISYVPLQPASRDISSLFASDYQVTSQNADQLASSAAKNLTFDKLKELVDLPNISSDWQLNIKSTTADDLNGTINVVLEQIYQEVTLPNEISFEITGFNLRSSASLFAQTYNVISSKSASLPSSIISSLTSYDALVNYVNLPEIPNDFSFQLKSVKANDPDNSIDIILDQTYLSNSVNDPISFKITNFNNTISDSWVPINNDLITSGITDLTNKKEFNEFIINHWNQSLANDALNAIRWVYNDADGQKVLTNNLRQYIADGAKYGNPTNWTIGYLMGWNYSQTANFFNGTIEVKNPEAIPLNPIYTSNVNLQPNGDLKLTLGWYQKQYYQKTRRGNYTADVNGSVYFDVSTSIKPSINSTNGNAQILNTRLEAIINNEAPGQRPTVHDGASVTINILDALYYYYNQTSTDGITIKNSMFSSNGTSALDWAKNPYSLFNPLFSILDTNKDKFTYRK